MGDMLVCGDCGHFFDSADKRANLAYLGDPRFPPTCPACSIQTMGGTEAWGLANDCQGLFDETVRGSRKEANAKLDPNYHGMGCKVVPVRIYVEREDRFGLRNWLEDQREADAA
jgi:hypothetical protein